MEVFGVGFNFFVVWGVIMPVEFSINFSSFPVVGVFIAGDPDFQNKSLRVGISSHFLGVFSGPLIDDGVFHYLGEFG